MSPHSQAFFPTMKTNYEKKLFIARVILALALLVGVLSAFQDWELYSEVGFGKEPRRYTLTYLARALAFIILEKYSTISMTIRANEFIQYAIIFFLFCFLLIPIFLARMFSQSRTLWWLWMFLYISWHSLLGYLYQENAYFLFMVGFASEIIQPHHLSWLSGFYFGCAAVILHLLGMMVLYFSSPPKSDPSVEAHALS